MSYIIIRSPRTTQPQGPVRIDWSNPLTRGLSILSAATGLGHAANLVGTGSTVVTKPGSITTDVSSVGKGQRTNGAYWTTTGCYQPAPSGSQPWSGFVVVVPRAITTGGPYSFLSLASVGAARPIIMIGVWGNDTFVYTDNDYRCVENDKCFDNQPFIYSASVAPASGLCKALKSARMQCHRHILLVLKTAAAY
jgi:hypothetical protein